MQRRWWPSCVVAIRNGGFLPRRVPSRNRRGRSWWLRLHRLELWGLKPQGVCKSCRRWWGNFNNSCPIKARWSISRSIRPRLNSASPRPSGPEGPRRSTGWPPKSGPGGGMGVWPNFAAKLMLWRVCFPSRQIGLYAVAFPQHSSGTPASAARSKPRQRPVFLRQRTASRSCPVLDPKRSATTCR